MKLIDTFFCLIYRIGMELYLHDEKESKFIAVGFLLAWSTAVFYDCYLCVLYFFDLENTYYNVPFRAIEFSLWGIFGIIWSIRYYRCKKSITQEFDAIYKTWHPDTRAFFRVFTIIILLLPLIALFLIHKLLLSDWTFF